MIRLFTGAFIIVILVIAASCGEAAPIAGFQASNVTGLAPITVQFTDQSQGEIDSWEWDFYNNGSIDSTEQNPSYRYTANGNHTVSLTVYGPYGQDTMTKEGYIYITGCPT